MSSPADQREACAKQKRHEVPYVPWFRPAGPMMGSKLGGMEGPLRIDKWLWAARFFKTRALATAACDAGHIVCNGQTAKPSRIVKVGDKLNVRSEAGDYEIEILLLSDQRGSATVAQTLYRENDASRELRAKVAEARKAMVLADPSFARGRPTKRDRRLIHSFRGRD